MLFRFNKFWQTLALVIGSWVFYGIWGFEMTAITLLAVILGYSIDSKEKFL
jgi:hypothetical protein